MTDPGTLWNRGAGIPCRDLNVHGPAYLVDDFQLPYTVVVPRTWSRFWLNLPQDCLSCYFLSLKLKG